MHTGTAGRARLSDIRPEPSLAQTFDEVRGEVNGWGLGHPENDQGGVADDEGAERIRRGPFQQTWKVGRRDVYRFSEW